MSLAEASGKFRYPRFGNDIRIGVAADASIDVSTDGAPPQKKARKAPPSGPLDVDRTTPASAACCRRLQAQSAVQTMAM